MGLSKKLNSKRRYPGERSGARPDLVDLRRNEAKERQAYYDGLTAAEKLEALDRKLGKGVGASKQREKLAALVGQ